MWTVKSILCYYGGFFFSEQRSLDEVRETCSLVWNSTTIETISDKDMRDVAILNINLWAISLKIS